MPFIPHSEADQKAMLQALKIDDINALYDEIPKDLPTADLSQCPSALSEMAMTRLMQQREPDNKNILNFIGAGAYEHFSPAAIGDIISRGEFYTAYTPYQAEASQGSLQVIFEYQHMMTRLLSMETSNASLYEGASALAEAALMAVRIKRSKVTQILVPHSLHPHYQAVLHSILPQQGITLQTVAMNADGMINQDDLQQHMAGSAALILPQPNFFGLCDDVHRLTDLAHQHNVLVIANVNPQACAWLTPPGEWGDQGADIACGEGQPLGIPLASGGPYFGFMTTRKAFIRQMPGRIVGQTTDQQGRTGYTLTLQAREQHIRRAKATSNICTNQGLMVVAASVYLQLMGGTGLQQCAQSCHQRLQQLIEGVNAIPQIELTFNGPQFHETVLQFKHHRCQEVLTQLRQHGIQGGFDLSPYYPELGQALLVCTTETKTADDIEYFLSCLTNILTA